VKGVESVRNRVYAVHSVRRITAWVDLIGQTGGVVVALVSLVSVLGRNWFYLCERG